MGMLSELGVIDDAELADVFEVSECDDAVGTEDAVVGIAHTEIMTY